MLSTGACQRTRSVHDVLMHSVPEAAKLLGLAPATLRQQIRNGKLAARKISRDWYISTEEVERYRAAHKRNAA